MPIDAADLRAWAKTNRAIVARIFTLAEQAGEMGRFDIGTRDDDSTEIVRTTKALGDVSKLLQWETQAAAEANDTSRVRRLMRIYDAFLVTRQSYLPLGGLRAAESIRSGRATFATLVAQSATSTIIVNALMEWADPNSPLGDWRVDARDLLDGGLTPTRDAHYLDQDMLIETRSKTAWDSGVRSLYQFTHTIPPLKNSILRYRSDSAQAAFLRLSVALTSVEDNDADLARFVALVEAEAKGNPYLDAVASSVADLRRRRRKPDSTFQTDFLRATLLQKGHQAKVRERRERSGDLHRFIGDSQRFRKI